MSAIDSIQGARDERIRDGLERAGQQLDQQQYHLLVLTLTGLLDCAASAYGSQQFVAGQDSARRIHDDSRGCQEVRL